MQSVLRIIASRWVLTLIGTALLAALAWIFGPLVEVLESWPARLAIVVAMLLVWAVLNLALDLARLQRERALSQGVAGKPDATSEEATAVAAKLTEALTLLKKQGGGGYLYEQPWYVIIGPPGAGKTTALLNAGLNFPLADKMGQGAVAGVGGTRLCDWWFTENAVMIDTAGRYTTQDSDATIDRAGWEAFLNLLKRTRTRQPLNGVIVAIALSDIAAASSAERSSHARAISVRIQELESRLGIRIPVYAVFTKSDLIAGFSEFFDDLDRDTRAQVWGTTFHPTPDAKGAVPQFATAFKALVERLNSRLFARLQAERSPDRRALIAGFPTQVASLERPLLGFLEEAFGPASATPVPLLRGAYFTSGTQEGTPIDRLTGALSRTFGLDQKRAPALRPEQGRSYFLGQLLKQVIFGEAMLVSDNPAARRRERLLRLAGYATAVLIVVIAAGVLFVQRQSNLEDIDTLEAALATYEQSTQGLPLDPVADDDLQRLVPLLDQARALPHGVDSHELPAGDPFGLSQQEKLQSAARSVYRHALERALLPRLLWRLEAQMRGNLFRPEFLYEATRVYLMLGAAGPLDRGLVHDWTDLDWQIAYPGADQAKLRTRLALHLDALLSDTLPQVSLDGELIAQARDAFSKIPLATRVYSRIKPSAAAQRLAPWRPSDTLGAAGGLVMLRSSGRPLTDGIPGFFTLEGFHKVLLPSLTIAARSVAGESWVLGKRTEPLDPKGPEMQALQHDVIALYKADYIDAWERMLADLDIVPMRSLSQAAQSLYILSSQESPMRNLLASVARQVTLSVPPDGTAPPKPAITDSSDNAQLRAVLGATAQPTAALPGADVDAHFKALRDLVGTGVGAPIDQELKAIYDLQQLLAKMAAAPIGSAVPAVTSNDPAMVLRADAVHQPAPLNRWLAAMATSGISLRNGNTKQQIASAFNTPDGPGAVCKTTTKGIYPFDRAGKTDAAIDDFAKLFAPGAVMDGFFNTQLRAYTDVSGKPWKPIATDAQPAVASPEDIAQFQRAAALRDAFFADGSTTPSLRFDIAGQSIDATSHTVSLDLGGTIVAAIHGPPRPAQINWPGGINTVRLVFDPPLPGNAADALTQTGPWALFKLFEKAKLTPGTSADHVTLTFQFGNRQAAFDIHTNAGANPFAPGLLADFRCPTLP